MCRDNACIVRDSNPHNLIETVPEPVEGLTRIAGLSQIVGRCHSGAEGATTTPVQSDTPPPHPTRKGGTEL
jgi:hypothetical protein